MIGSAQPVGRWLFCSTLNPFDGVAALAQPRDRGAHGMGLPGEGR